MAVRWFTVLVTIEYVSGLLSAEVAFARATLFAVMSSEVVTLKIDVVESAGASSAAMIEISARMFSEQAIVLCESQILYMK